MSKTKISISKEVKELTQIIIQSNMHYEIWWELSGPNRPNHVSLLNSNLHFWSSTIDAHFLSLVIFLYKLYDPRNDTLSLIKLQKKVMHNKLLKEKDLKYLQSEYEKAKYIWEKIKTLRHNYYAHRSKKFSITEIYKQADIKPDQFKELIVISQKIIDIIYGNTNGCTIIFSISAKDDILNVLNKLQSLFSANKNLHI